MGNPFTEEKRDLLTLNTKDTVDPSVAQLNATHLERGKEQFKTFLDKLQADSHCFYQSIKKTIQTSWKFGQSQPTNLRLNYLRRIANCFPAFLSPAKPEGMTYKNFSNMKTSLSPLHSGRRVN